MTVVPVILKCEPVSRLDRAIRRTRDASVAVVYVMADGTVEVIDGGKPMRFKAQLAGRYRTRYEVDLSDHYHTVHLQTSPPPAQGGIYHFVTHVNIGFRVLDPGQVVRKNVRDALQLVCDYLMFAFRDITANFPIEAAKAAENAINARFQHGTVVEDCIQLYLCRARLAPDAAAAEYLRAVVKAGRSNTVKAAEHEVNVDDGRRGNELSLIQQSGSLTQREREREALAGRPLDARDLVALHLEGNPGDTAWAIEIAEAAEARRWSCMQAADEQQWKKFEFLTDRNLVQAVDVGGIRDQVISGVSQPAPALAARAAMDSWDAPLAVEGVRNDASPTPSDDRGLIPIYVVIDESSAIAAGVSALNTGFQSLYDTVASQPDIARVVRLAVVSYADNAAVRVAMQAVHAGSRLPDVAVGAGQARLSSAFERLMDCIPRDVETLKAQTTSLRRPQVLLLSGGNPADAPRWISSRQALIDRHTHRYAPDVIACGIGGAAPRTMLTIATSPELAFVAPGRDIDVAVSNFCAFVQRRIIEYGRTVLLGEQNSTVLAPVGFRPAAELLTSPNPEG